MSGSQYRYLFTPLRLGPVTVANRIVFSRPPHELRRGRPADRAARRLLRGPGRGRRRADHHRGALDPPDRLALREADPRLPPRGHPRLPAHHRRRAPPRHADLRPDQPQRRPGVGHVHPAAGVGAVAGAPTRCSARCPRRSTAREIAEIVAGYASSPSTAGRAASTASSCSARTARSCAASCRRPRTSAPTRYGGALENRARLLLEIVAAVRDAIGRDLALGVRLCGDELIEGGTTIDEAVEVAQAGRGRRAHVDYINTSIGVATATLFMIEASMHVPPGYALFIPSALRKAVDLPVVGVGRFKDPLQAERALAEGHCDLVGVVRGPDRRRRLRRQGPGRARRRHPAVPVVQPGVRRPHGPEPLARLHREPAHRPRGDAPAAAPAGRCRCAPRQVLVVGAGPAGLQAAIAAAAARPRGSRCRARRPSPAARCALAASVPSRAEFGDLVRNQVHECGRLGVAIAAVRGRPPTLRSVRRAARRRGRRHRCRAGPAVVGAGRRTATIVDVRRRARRRGRSPSGRRRGDRRARLPPGHVGGRAAGRPGLRRRGRSPRAWSSARTSASRSTWRLVDAGRGQGHRADARTR